MHRHARVIDVQENEFEPGTFTARLALARLYANAPQAFGTLALDSADAVYPGQFLMVAGESIGGHFIADRIVNA